MRRHLYAILLLFGFAGFVCGLVVSGRLSSSEATFASPAAVQGRPLPISGALPDLSPVAERALKVSANISSTQVVRTPTDPFYRMFGGDAWVTQQATSLGSGVIVSADGYVLTNNHVIGNAAADIRVTLPDGHEMKGQIVGVDDITDLAVVKVSGQNLPTLPWGDSSQLRVAEWVLAVGNPFQFSKTVTLGIVSAVSRPGAELNSYNDLIQTDAAINPGNSGGALVDSRGELVGINSMIYSETGGYQGIGFAIPSNQARRIMDELIKNGGVSWGSVGRVNLQTIDEASARRYGLATAGGVYVDSLYRNSSAYQGGLQPEDVIVGFNGQTVTDAAQLNRLIVGSRPGTTAKVDVFRNGRRVTLTIPIVSRQAVRR